MEQSFKEGLILTPTQLLAIREEFYTTSLSIEDLCLKYELEELPGSHRWVKPSSLTPPEQPSEPDEVEDLSPEEQSLKTSLYTQAEAIMRKCNRMLMKVDNPRDLKDIASIHKDIFQAHFGKVQPTKTEAGEDEFGVTLKSLMEKYSDE